MLSRRGDGTKRIVFIVDEVGQYVARSIPRMFDLQGLAEAFQKRRGPLWLVVTSQEKLGDVVDSLESRQVEYARVQDRFPMRFDPPSHRYLRGGEPTGYWRRRRLAKQRLRRH